MGIIADRDGIWALAVLFGSERFHWLRRRAGDFMPTFIEQAANPVDHCADAGRAAKVAMHDDPMLGSDLR